MLKADWGVFSAQYMWCVCICCCCQMLCVWGKRTSWSELQRLMADLCVSSVCCVLNYLYRCRQKHTAHSEILIRQTFYLIPSRIVPFLFQVYLNLYLSIAHERIIHPYLDLESFFMFSKVAAAYYTLYVYEVKLWDTSLNVIFSF